MNHNSSLDSENRQENVFHRTPDPQVEHNLLKRFLSSAVPGKFLQFAKNPTFAIGVVKDRLYECAHPNFPLLAPGAIHFLARNVKQNHVGFEWGSGGSTIWFGRHCKKLISIEDVEEWFGYISQKLRDEDVKSVDLRLVKLEYDGAWPPPEEPNLVAEYIEPINEFPGDFFDFVLIDGHYRLACIQAALSKLKVGGLLIVDDTHWIPLETYQVPKHWQIVSRRRSALKETTIWRARG